MCLSLLPYISCVKCSLSSANSTIDSAEVEGTLMRAMVFDVVGGFGGLSGGCRDLHLAQFKFPQLQGK